MGSPPGRRTEAPREDGQVRAGAPGGGRAAAEGRRDPRFPGWRGWDAAARRAHVPRARARRRVHVLCVGGRGRATVRACEAHGWLLVDGTQGSDTPPPPRVASAWHVARVRSQRGPRLSSRCAGWVSAGVPARSGPPRLDAPRECLNDPSRFYLPLLSRVQGLAFLFVCLAEPSCHVLAAQRAAQLARDSNRQPCCSHS